MKASDRLEYQAIIATLVDLPKDYGGDLNKLKAILSQGAKDRYLLLATLQQIINLFQDSDIVFNLFQNHYDALSDRYNTTVKNKLGKPPSHPEKETDQPDLENFTLPADQVIALNEKISIIFKADNPISELQADAANYQRNHPNSDPYDYSDSLCNQ